MKTCFLSLFFAFLALTWAPPSYAGGSRVAANRNYTNGICHQKIDPKNLTGQAKKDAWKACRTDPDGYN